MPELDCAIAEPGNSASPRKFSANVSGGHLRRLPPAHMLKVNQGRARAHQRNSRTNAQAVAGSPFDADRCRASGDDLTHCTRTQRRTQSNVISTGHPTEHRGFVDWRFVVAANFRPQNNPFNGRNAQILVGTTAFLVSLRAPNCYGRGSVRVHLKIGPQQNCCL